jgi:predicted amidohydrolase
MTIRKVIVAFAQTNPVFGKIEANVRDAMSLMQGIKADLVVFPELFNTGYNFATKKEVHELSEEIPSGLTCKTLLIKSRDQNRTFVAGIAELSGDKIYNSAVIVSKGCFIGKYRKLHLFNKEKIWFHPGNLQPRVYTIGGYRLGVMICFDWIFPEVSRSLALLGADVIAHPSNLVLPGYCQKTMPIRAFENHVYIITSNRIGEERRGEDYFRYTGESLICSPMMKVLVSATADEVVCKSAEIDISLARNKKLTALNQIFKDRRPRFYSQLTS